LVQPGGVIRGHKAMVIAGNGDIEADHANAAFGDRVQRADVGQGSEIRQAG
jgi:hypothetical protein